MPRRGRNAAQVAQESESPRPTREVRDRLPGVPPHEGTNTTHYSIIDRWGNAVSVTYTLNGGYGNGITVPGLGFLLNNGIYQHALIP